MNPLRYRGYGSSHGFHAKQRDSLKPGSSKDLREPQHLFTVDQHLQEDIYFSYVDFVPAFRKKINESKAEYHPFSYLVEYANRWLFANEEWNIINCETITKYNHSLQKNGEKSVSRHCSLRGEFPRAKENHLLPAFQGLATPHDIDYSAIVKVLRIWITRSDHTTNSEHNNAHRLRFTDFKPTAEDNIDTLVQAANRHIFEEKLKGNIITVQTVDCDSSEDWKFNPEETFCGFGKMNEDKKPKFKVSILRIFYDVDHESNEEIGIQDFLPVQETADGTYEKFSNLIKRSAKWLNENPEVHFCGAQTLDTGLSDETEVPDTRKISKRDVSGNKEVRFLRIYFKKPIEVVETDTNQDIEPGPPPAPVYLSSSILMAKNCIPPLNHRYISDCLCQSEKYKQKILAVETVVLPPFINDNKDDDFNRSAEEVLGCNRIKGRFRYSFSGIRLYCDEGYYNSKKNSFVESEMFYVEVK